MFIYDGAASSISIGVDTAAIVVFFLFLPMTFTFVPEYQLEDKFVPEHQLEDKVAMPRIHVGIHVRR